MPLLSLFERAAAFAIERYFALIVASNNLLLGIDQDGSNIGNGAAELEIDAEKLSCFQIDLPDILRREDQEVVGIRLNF